MRETVPCSDFDTRTRFTLTREGLARSVGADKSGCPLLVQARQLQQRQRLVAQADVHRLRARTQSAATSFPLKTQVWLQRPVC